MTISRSSFSLLTWGYLAPLFEGEIVKQEALHFIEE